MSIIIKIFRSCGISFVLFVLLTLLAAVILSFTSVPSTLSPIMSIGVLAIACGFMGLFVGNMFSKRGLLSGAVAAFLLEIFIITLIMLMFSINIADYSLEAKHIIPVITGAAGGVIGIGMKK